jgi:hypothetical protein
MATAHHSYRRRLTWVASVLVGLSAFCTTLHWQAPNYARADYDPTIAHRLTNEALGSAKEISGDTGRSRFLIPKRPTLAWRTRLRAPVSSLGGGEDNALLAATLDARLTELDGRGLQRWSKQLTNTAMAPPLLTRAGERLVLTHGAQLASFSRTGRLLYKRQLPLDPNGVSGRLLELSNGSLLVRVGRQVARLDRDGTVRGSVTLDATVESWFVDGWRFVLHTDDGALSRWDGYFRPKRVTSATSGTVLWMGAPAGALRASGSALTAQPEYHAAQRWLQLDSGEFWGPIAQHAEPGRIVVRAKPDLILVADATGELERRVLSTTPPARNQYDGLLVDQRGVVAAMANDGALAVVSDTVRRLRLSGCSSVLDLASIGPDVLAAACSDGVVVGIGLETAIDR